MNTLGKVLLGLVILTSLGATVLTAKLIQVRNSYTRKYESLEKQRLTAAKNYEEAARRKAALQAEYLRETMGWDRVYPRVPTSVLNAQQGRLSADIGRVNGLKEKQWLYGFQLSPEGAIYRGTFEVVQLGDNNVALQPVGRFRPEQAAGLQNGEWRWRTMIPVAYPTRSAALEQSLLLADEQLIDAQKNVEVQDQLLAEAKSQEERRRQELVGGDQLPTKETLPTEERMGLVAGLEEAEEQRNALLVEIDGLRRAVRKVSRQITDAQAENETLSDSLPQPGNTAAKPVTQAAQPGTVRRK